MSVNRVTPQDPDPALKNAKDNIVVKSGHLNPLIDSFNKIVTTSYVSTVVTAAQSSSTDSFDVTGVKIGDKVFATIGNYYPGGTGSPVIQTAGVVANGSVTFEIFNLAPALGPALDGAVPINILIFKQ
jgi:hypothetical protein